VPSFVPSFVTVLIALSERRSLNVGSDLNVVLAALGGLAPNGSNVKIHRRRITSG
jgi:hypothetical protein